MHVAARFSGPGQPYEGLAKRDPTNWTGVIRLVPEKLAEPLSWRKPCRVFVNSMSDLFHEDVPDEYIDKVFAVMGVAYWHTFQVLTKRADRMAAYFRETWQVPAKAAERVYDIDLPEQVAYIEDRWDRINKACDDIPLKSLGSRCWDEENSLIGRPAWPRKPPANVWLGVSVEDQARADERIPHLLRTPAAVRFLSVEPLLGEVDFEVIPEPRHPDRFLGFINALDDGIDQVIVGAESGHGARPMDDDWVRLIRDQCRATGTAFFFKQKAENGRKISLPMLDGRQWAEFPTPRAEVAR